MLREFEETTVQRYKFAQAPVQEEDVYLEEDVRLDDSITAHPQGASAAKPRRVRRILILNTALKDADGALGTPGRQLTLQRMPDYPGDKWAIRVFDPQETALGYIPFGRNQSTARMIDGGRRIVAEVAEDSRLINVYIEIEVQDEEEDK